MLYLSFDEFPDRIVCNVASVGIDLARYWNTGQLTKYAFQAGTAPAVPLRRSLRR